MSVTLLQESSPAGPAGYEDWWNRLYWPGVEIIQREGEEKGLLPAIRAMYKQQVAEWPRLRLNVRPLNKIGTRKIRVSGRTVWLQHNPARLVNATAPSDPKTIAARPCPLMPENMPVEQKALPYAGEWAIVCNPLPFSRLHLVLAHRLHLPQTVRGIIREMLRFTGITGFVTLYNAPGSGASIPDHLHLQAAPGGGLPLENQLPPVDNGFHGILTDPAVPQRIFLYADSPERMEELLEKTIRRLNRCSGRPEEEEPRLNLAVISRGAGELPLVVVHPRTAHRPSCYFAKGEKHFMVSPGSVDMAGLLIVPRPEDYQRLDGRKVRSIFEDVCPDPAQFACLAGELRKL